VVSRSVPICADGCASNQFSGELTTSRPAPPSAGDEQPAILGAVTTTPAPQAHAGASAYAAEAQGQARIATASRRAARLERSS